MVQALKQLDSILRGDTTRLETLKEQKLTLPVGSLTVVVLALAGIYGVCMGAYAVVQAGGPGLMQMVASMVKVPLLFVLTLVIAFPSLYVFNALIGSALQVVDVLKLLIASMGVSMAVLASLGPIEAFFAVSSTSYSFVVLLNVLIMAVSGALGMGFLLQTLHRMSLVHDLEQAPSRPAFPTTGADAAEDAPTLDPEHQTGPLDMDRRHVLGAHVKTVFHVWIIVYGVVGAQMGWLLRPFIGSPDMPFTWFRGRESSFFEAVWSCLTHLFA